MHPTEERQTDPAARRAELLSLLGDLPDLNRPITAELVREEARAGYHLEVLTLDLNGIEPVPAYFVKPNAGGGPFPTVIYNHSHGGAYHIGKDELLTGREYLQSPPYAEALTAQGYAALCIDAWCFGERHDLPELELVKLMLWRGQVLWGMMVYDSLRAVDYAISRPDVDAARLATLGMSMGSTMAWYLAALDPRIKVCVDICCLTDFQALIDAGGLGGHGIYYYVPGLLKHFTTAEINALIVPRPHLGLAGNLDPLTPAAGLDRIDAALRDVYAAAGAPDAWRMSRYDVQHVETPGMRAEVLAWLERWL
jgi:dienelactone hydrolase